MNKVLKVIVIIMVLVFVAIGVMLVYSKNDLKRTFDKNDNVDVVQNNEIQERSNDENITKIEELPEKYSFIQAIKDKCVVSGYKKMYNKDVLDKFVENVNNGKKGFMRLISYTIEGDMIITDIDFDGKIFEVCFDWTRDEYSSKEDRIYKYCKYEKFEEERTETGTYYYVDSPLDGDLGKRDIVGYENNIEFINDYKFNYILSVKYDQNQEKNLEKITTDEFNNKYNYDVFYYGIDSAEITVDNEKMNLNEALNQEKVSMGKVIEQAEKDSESGIIVSDMYKEGGSMIYFYDTYTIIKKHSLDGNRDVYIGVPEMRLESIGKEKN